MPLTPYTYRPLTPPVAEVPALSGRRPSDASQWSMESFPDSIEQHARTPLDRSPARHPGQKLLPKLRTQDHTLEPSSHHIPASTQHRRAVSTSFEVPQQQHYEQSRRAVSTGYEVPPEAETPIFAIPNVSAPSSRSGTTATFDPLETPDPESAISACFSVFSDYAALESPVSFLPTNGPFKNAHYGHGRSVSASCIDPSTLLKYCNPAYRAAPGYINQGAYWSDIGLDGASTFIPPPLSATEATGPSEWDLPQEMQFTQADDAAQTLDTYLRAQNPALDLCSVASAPLARGMQQHFWWDIRNLRAWDSFSLQSILNVPGFPGLLQVPVASTALPDYASHLTRAQLYPETEASLTDAARVYFAAKVNAALKVAMPAHQVMAMRPCRDRDGPAFVSNYQNDAEKTFAGNGRGRVVGIVRSYRTWNSGLRSGNGVDKVRYLDALANLHRHMREHQTRYGFILTETELVCARAGTEETPYFGLLEVATPIELRLHGGASAASGSDDFGSTVGDDLFPTPPHSDIDGPPLTACLALWYLHMLAKEEPLPGQPSWRLHVGAPAAMTRQRVLAQKDKWIPPPQKRECRDSKTVRGWVWPTDPWNKKREGRVAGRR